MCEEWRGITYIAALVKKTSNDPINLKNEWKPKPLDSSDGADISLFGNLAETKEIPLETKKMSSKSRPVSTGSGDNPFDNLPKTTNPQKSDKATFDDPFDNLMKAAKPCTVYDNDLFSSPNQNEDSTDSDLLFKSYSEFQEEDIKSFDDFEIKPFTAKSKSRKTRQFKPKSKTWRESESLMMNKGVIQQSDSDFDLPVEKGQHDKNLPPDDQSEDPTHCTQAEQFHSPVASRTRTARNRQPQLKRR